MKQENFKQKSTALELFIKNRNEYLPTEVSEVQLISDHMKKGKFSPIDYFIPISKIYGFLKKTTLLFFLCRREF